MSCNEGDAIEPRESASSQVPEGSGPPIGHGNHVGQLERTPLQGISFCSDASEGGSRAKGKRRALELKGSMASGKGGSGSINAENKRRKRLNLEQKLEVLELLNAGTTKDEVARRYACCVWTVWQIARNKSELERKKESPGFNGKAKAEMPIGFPQVEDKVKRMVEDARRNRVPVTGDVLKSFGRVVKTQMLSSKAISDGERTSLASFCASGTWARNFAKRHGLVREVLHGEAGGVDREAAKEGIESNMGYRSDDELENNSKEVGSKQKTPQELSIVLDILDEHAKLVGSPNVQDLLRQLREELIPDSLEERTG